MLGLTQTSWHASYYMLKYLQVFQFLQLVVSHLQFIWYYWFRRIYKIDNDTCKQCGTSSESLEHLFLKVWHSSRVTCTSDRNIAQLYCHSLSYLSRHNWSLFGWPIQKKKKGLTFEFLLDKFYFLHSKTINI